MCANDITERKPHPVLSFARKSWGLIGLDDRVNRNFTFHSQQMDGYCHRPGAPGANAILSFLQEQRALAGVAALRKDSAAFVAGTAHERGGGRAACDVHGQHGARVHRTRAACWSRG